MTLQADEYALFRDLYSIMYGDLPRPELILYIHLDMTRVKERIRTRGRSYEQSIPIEYLEQLQKRYLDHLQKLTDDRVLVVDLQEHDLMNAPSVYEKLMDSIAQDRPKGYHVITL